MSERSAIDRYGDLAVQAFGFTICALLGTAVLAAGIVGWVKVMRWALAAVAQ